MCEVPPKRHTYLLKYLLTYFLTTYLEYSFTNTSTLFNILPGGTVGYPAQPGLIRPSVCTCLQIRYSAENSTGPTDSVKFSSKS